jgi:RNA polymerase sigma-70 factor (ECF subfamily)
MPVVLRTAQCLTTHSDQAEDLAQETMVKAMRAIDSYQDNTDIRAWLLTILRRTHIDHLRSDRHRARELSLDGENGWMPAEASQTPGPIEEPWNDPEDLMNRFEDEAVIDALRALPESMRWTLLLVDVEQMEQTDAAAVLGVAVGTIKSRAHRARAMLRERLHEAALKRGWIGTPERSK